MPYLSARSTIDAKFQHLLLHFPTVAAKKEESDRKWSLDPIQRAMGQLGWWHILVCAVVFPLKFPVAWHQMSIIFLGPSVNYTCASDPSLDRCDAGCTSWTYDNSTFATTLTSEWDLVCGNANLVKLSQTIFMFGILVGGVVFGSLADKYVSSVGCESHPEDCAVHDCSNKKLPFLRFADMDEDHRW